MTPARTAERIRVAAVGDLHMHAAVAGRFRPDFLRLSEAADVLLLAGDLTDGGTRSQADLLCAELEVFPCRWSPYSAITTMTTNRAT